MSKRKRTLVSGGAGFIGSQLCERLIAEGRHVVCVDNLHTGRRRNIENLLDHSEFEYLHHDIIDPLTIEVDEIYNLACPASPIHYQEDPIRTTKTSVLGAINLLSLAERLEARILQASTSEVYGEPTVHPQPENYVGHVNFTGPRGCYDEGKRCAETLFADYRRQCRVDARVARIFNTYGPGMQLDDGRVVCNFIVQSLRNLPITIYGDGSQTRSFCYVADTIDGLSKLMALAGKAPEPINIGNPFELSVLDLAERIIILTGSRSKIERWPLPVDDPTRRRPDISRAMKLLGWRPNVTFEVGLAATVAYVESELTRVSHQTLKAQCEVA